MCIRDRKAQRAVRFSCCMTNCKKATEFHTVYLVCRVRLITSLHPAFGMYDGWSIFTQERMLWLTELCDSSLYLHSDLHVKINCVLLCRNLIYTKPSLINLFNCVVSRGWLVRFVRLEQRMEWHMIWTSSKWPQMCLHQIHVKRKRHC